MIKVEGYKAFHGLMRIESKSKRVPVIEIEGDWLYKPHTNTWHCNGISYPAKICTVVRNDSEKQIPKKPILKETKCFDGSTDDFWFVCSVCNRTICREDDVIADHIKEEYTHCHCGQALDWSV